jgi:hypothetical protein
VGRQQIREKFMSLRPNPGAPIGDCFCGLLQLQSQIRGTDEEVSETAFKTHIFGSLPPAIEDTARIRQNTPHV